MFSLSGTIIRVSYCNVNLWHGIRPETQMIEGCLANTGYGGCNLDFVNIIDFFSIVKW